MRLILLIASLLPLASPGFAQPFLLPTANRHLFAPGEGELFYVGTEGKPWPSGAFGCTRSSGWQMHEGLDIRCLERDRKGNPADPVLATAAGTVAYINNHAGLSNYGRYIVIEHEIEGLEIFSIYAHLSETAPGLRIGQTVSAGEQIGVMGTTSNTRERITKERAHLHFELVFALNPRYIAWHKQTYRVKKVEHGRWNGQNLLGIDPARIFLAQDQQGKHFRLLQALIHETELCRVLILEPDLHWARRFPDLVQPNPLTDNEGIAGYELALTFNGVPFHLIPRAASEIKQTGRFQLLSVNAAEYERNRCRRIVEQKDGQWQLAATGHRLLDLLAY